MFLESNDFTPFFKLAKVLLNAANLSLWMVNVSQAMLVTSGEESILDLKAHYHGLRYTQEIFKILPDNQYLRQIVLLPNLTQNLIFLIQ